MRYRLKLLISQECWKSFRKYSLFLSQEGISYTPSLVEKVDHWPFYCNLTFPLQTLPFDTAEHLAPQLTVSTWGSAERITVFCNARSYMSSYLGILFLCWGVFVPFGLMNYFHLGKLLGLTININFLWSSLKIKPLYFLYVKLIFIQDYKIYYWWHFISRHPYLLMSNKLKTIMELGSSSYVWLSFPFHQPNLSQYWSL